MKLVLLMMLLLVGSSYAFAAEGYFTVKEPSSAKADFRETSLDPITTAEEVWGNSLESFYELREVVSSLLEFDFHSERYGDVPEPYKRERHFGKWIVDPSKGSCLNTRAQVLIRDSQVPVQYRPSGCSVESGRWEDPYTGSVFTDANDMQIDHFVPLKNAYISGAARWNFEKRCLYANFLGNNFQLLPVSGNENQRKSDHTPEDYMPANSAYQCQYLQQWLKVKLIWSLALTPSEKKRVIDLTKQNRCAFDKMMISQADLEQQRRFIADNMNLCH